MLARGNILRMLRNRHWQAVRLKSELAVSEA